MKRSALKRKTALKPSSKPLKRSKGLARGKPLRKAKASVRSAQASQRKAVKERSGGRCEFFVSVIRYHSAYEVEYDSVRCTLPAVDPAHIIPRRECGKARDLPEVVVHACRRCHEVYDDPAPVHSWVRPRVPEILLASCRRAIKESNQKAPLKNSNAEG